MNDMNENPSRGKSSALLTRLGELWLTYIKGQLFLALLIGMLTWTINSAIGLHWAGAMGLIAGMFETIPTFGPLLATIPAVIIALWKGSTIIPLPNWGFALIVLGIYVAIQQIEAIFVQPRIMGSRLDLPPLAVILAVIVGAALGNVIGAYLAVPVVASVREIILFWREPPP